MANYSVEDVKRKISKDALEFFEKNFKAEHQRLIYDAMRFERISTFRLNPLKGDRTEVISLLKKENIKFQDFMGIRDAFILNDEVKTLEKSTPYKEGKIYLQGFSGMLAPLFLAPLKGERVVDLAAAPGSKTTMLSALMNNTGVIDALEPDFIRLERLKFNCTTLGATNVNFFQGRGESFYKDREGQYDRVLADVPCSGEGRFNLYDPPSYCFWKLSERAKFAKLQKKILTSGIRLLKSGGTLLYSTCTLNQEENEDVLSHAFLEWGDQIESLPLPVSPQLIEEYLYKSDKKIHSLRIIPSKRFEGFFLSMIRKK